ncbi:hypothetical protein CEQ21_02070 [Niallia circulans]|uniref:Uncharacterized protein n=1 Tax=Niallia circulans TaxID=1397 RepID=A0A553SS02_NIACI|nr:hypothetical protein [Niallia circulans]TRZ39756.1 hypothetical protein CEQ21_02070 [Niallia circulans]
MKVIQEAAEFHSNEYHEILSLGLAFVLNGKRFSVLHVYVVADVITCVSKTEGFAYDELEEFLEEGRAYIVFD